VSVLAAGCRVGVEHDCAPRVGVYGQRLRRSPGHGGCAAASVDNDASAFDFDRAHGDVALRRQSASCPVQVHAVIVDVHRDGEDLTFADDLGRDRSY